MDDFERFLILDKEITLTVSCETEMKIVMSHRFQTSMTKVEWQWKQAFVNPTRFLSKHRRYRIYES